MTTSTLMPLPPMPLPPHQSGLIIEAVERHNVSGGQVREALQRVNQAINIAWRIRPADQLGLTEAQFTQLVCHCCYPQVLDAAFTAGGVADVAVRIRRFVAELDA
ncbi:hypothetical protein [Actinacidiphila soli]|uniref:hypothetical protein n=1 Tax=Actinacidiphila soli TaxID=2487275 RepID=UPI000FC9DDB6|nr:hypothetical protein [Actinacidiphila soli]